MPDTVELLIKLDLGPAPDASEAEERTLAIRRELLELDVLDVRRIAGDVPVGAKGAEAVIAGTLMVTLGQEVIKALVSTAADWLRRRRQTGENVGVRIQIGDDVLQLADTREADLRAAEAFIARHTDSGADRR